MSEGSCLVYESHHSLYGFKPSPRTWFRHISLVVQDFCMFCSTIDHSVFYNHYSLWQCMYLIVYMNDIIITGSDQDGIQKLKQHLFNHFTTKDIGKCKYFLRIEIIKFWCGPYLKNYALNILEKIGMLDCKPIDTPMDPNIKLIGIPHHYSAELFFLVSFVSQFLWS